MVWPIKNWTPGIPEKERLMMKRLIIALFAMGLLAIASTGCNTVHGAGEDLEHAGDKIQEHTPP
jgi:predicted small secreted protein